MAPVLIKCFGNRLPFVDQPISKLKPNFNILGSFGHILKDWVCNFKAEVLACLPEGWATSVVSIVTKSTKNMSSRVVKIILAGDGPTKKLPYINFSLST
jgi:hypothetical protein